MTDSAPIEQIARAAASKIHEECLTGTDVAYHQSLAGKIITEALRQACGQQPAVPEPGLIQDVYTFVEAALKVGDHSKELDFIRQLLAYIDWQKRTYGPVAGYKLVPIEPTLEMQKAYFDSIDRHMDRVTKDLTFGRFCNHTLAYAAMLAAAPTPPVQQTGTWGKCICGTNIRIRNARLYCPKCKEDFGTAAPHPVRGGEQ